MVPATFQSLNIWRVQHGSTLLGGQPVAKPDTDASRSLHSRNTSGQLGAQQSRVRCLIGKPAHGRQTEIDGCRREVARLKVKAIPKHHRFAECQPGL